MGGGGYIARYAGIYEKHKAIDSVGKNTRVARNLAFVRKRRATFLGIFCLFSFVCGKKGKEKNRARWTLVRTRISLVKSSTPRCGSGPKCRLEGPPPPPDCSLGPLPHANPAPPLSWGGWGRKCCGLREAQRTLTYGKKIQPKEEVFGRISLRTSVQKLRSGPPNPGKTSTLAPTSRTDVHEKTSV